MVKLELRDRVEDGKLDLSMSELEEVPMKEMVPIKHKIKKMDLSNNQLVSMPPTFASQLTCLVELDLSKNKITEVPENFGLLTNLVHLDLYSNQIERLPLGFKNLTRLRWLDLKDNPLTPQLAKIAGPCVDQADCQKCAREIVLVMQEISRSIEDTRQQKLEERQHTTPKEKKKKKKNKGGAAANTAEARAQLNGSGIQQSSEQIQGDSPQSVGKMKTGAGAADAAIQNKPPALPLRLCYAMTRGFIWSLLLVAMFLAAAYIISLPAAKPYLARGMELYDEAMLAFQSTDIPAMASRLYKRTQENLGMMADVIQHWITQDLPIYLKQTGDYANMALEKIKNQVAQWTNSTVASKSN